MVNRVGVGGWIKSQELPKATVTCKWVVGGGRGREKSLTNTCLFLTPNKSACCWSFSPSLCCLGEATVHPQVSCVRRKWRRTHKDKNVRISAWTLRHTSSQVSTIKNLTLSSKWIYFHPKGLNEKTDHTHRESSMSWYRSARVDPVKNSKEHFLASSKTTRGMLSVLQ